MALRHRRTSGPCAFPLPSSFRRGQRACAPLAQCSHLTPPHEESTRAARIVACLAFSCRSALLAAAGGSLIARTRARECRFSPVPVASQEGHSPSQQRRGHWRGGQVTLCPVALLAELEPALSHAPHHLQICPRSVSSGAYAEAMRNPQPSRRKSRLQGPGKWRSMSSAKNGKARHRAALCPLDDARSTLLPASAT